MQCHLLVIPIVVVVIIRTVVSITRVVVGVPETTLLETVALQKFHEEPERKEAGEKQMIAAEDDTRDESDTNGNGG